MAGRKQAYFVDDEKREDISKRIFYLRTKRNMTQSEFAAALAAYIHKDHQFRYSTVSNWENGHPPRQKMLFCIADFFQVPPETFYLTEDGSFPKNSAHFVKVSSANDTEEEICRKLAQFDGQPVWCALGGGEMNLGAVGKWGLVCLEYRSIIFSVTNIVSFSKINFPVYKRPIQFEYAFESCGDSLTADEVKRSRKVWLEPLGGDYSLRQRMKGFGEYFKFGDCVIMDVDKCAYPMSSYEKTFICFDKEPVYTKEAPILEPTEEEIRKLAVERVRTQKLLRDSKQSPF